MSGPLHLAATSILLPLASVLSGPGPAADVCISEVAKLQGPARAKAEYFAEDVALGGDVAVVGSRLAEHEGLSHGSAFIFQRDAGAPDAWRLVAELDGLENDAFGFGDTLVLSGDLLVVGAPSAGFPEERPGSAHVFAHAAGNQWRPVAALIPADGAPNDRFGVSLAIAGDTLVVGADSDDDRGETSGSVYIFQREAGTAGPWRQVAKLTADDAKPQDLFGNSVGISGDVVAVGAPYDNNRDTNDAGAVYLFRRDAGGEGDWRQVAKLTAPDPEAGDLFGGAVAMSGDRLVAGAIGAHGGDFSLGSAFVFQRDAGGGDDWLLIAELTADDGLRGDNFSVSVAIRGSTVLVGAAPWEARPGAAYVFHLGPNSGEWEQVAKLAASDARAGDGFGSSLAIDRGAILVGAWDAQDLAPESGAAYVYRVESCQ